MFIEGFHTEDKVDGPGVLNASERLQEHVISSVNVRELLSLLEPTRLSIRLLPAPDDPR